MSYQEKIINNNIRKKTFDFAVRIVNLSKYLIDAKQEYIISKQILKSGTSVGANYREADNADSKAAFIHKLCGILRRQ
jgi:four helix bundle protein